MKNKDPRFNTSLYNHKMIGSLDMPLISNKDYNEVLAAVQNGDHDKYYEMKRLFTFEPKQEKRITDIINGLIL